MIHKKALFVFLVLTFGITIALLAIARMMGLTLLDAPQLATQLVIAVVMFIPGTSALLTQKLILKRSFKELGFRWGPWRMYLKAYGLILVMYILNYAITWIFIQKPDFSLASFMAQFGQTLSLPMPAPAMLAILTFVTLITSPILNLIPSLGEEVGWRGFLLPSLEPLGQIKAMCLSGIIWAFWHTPMILILGFGYGREMWPGVLLHFLLITSLGIWMGYVWFKTRSTILAAFIHAVFNAHAYGVWSVIFISDSKLVVGAIGLVNALLFACLGLITLWRARSQLSSTKTT